MSLTNKILIDADGVIAILKKDDSNHEKSLKIDLKIRDYKKYITNLVFAEVANVLSIKEGQNFAKQSIKDLYSSEVEIIFIDEYLFQKTVEVFAKQSKKGTSFVDCANLVVMQEHGIAKIFSFDSFYKGKRFTA